jgi:hydrogenase assembly chaperone HypC/HupF
MLARSLRCPPTTSLGRWFDAAAGLLACAATSAYEGQAPMLLEALAAQRRPLAAADRRCGADWLPLSADGVLDPLPLLGHLAEETDAARGAALLPPGAGRRPGALGGQAALQTGLHTVALGGGCFLNALLTVAAGALAGKQGITVLQARQAPPNDGALRWARPGWPCAQCTPSFPRRLNHVPGHPRARGGTGGDEQTAMVDLDGIRKEISLALVDGVQEGDYVILHVGYALSKLDPAEAERTLALFAARPSAA